MMRRYQSALELAPPAAAMLPGVIGVVFLAVVAVALSERGAPGWWPWLVLLPAAVGIALALRRIVHSEIALYLEHYLTYRQAQALDSDVRYAELHDRMLERTLRLADTIAQMTPAQLETLAKLPLSELDLLPGSGEFLVLPPGERVGVRSVRVPMLVVDELVATWRDLIGKGRNPYNLPPLRLWSDSKRRDFVRLIYAGLADAGLVHIKSTGSWSAGNTTATIAQDVGPEYVYQWLRSDEPLEREA